MGKYTWRQYWAEQRSPVPPLPQTDLSGQTVLVVGANTGVGFVASKYFASFGPARLIIACRNRAKGERALAEIQQETGFKNVDLRLVDLSSASSVSEFANKLQTENIRLDIVLANAGVVHWQYYETEDGWEETMRTNHIGTTHLCLRLLPLMLRTAREYAVRPRLTIVSSEAHYWATLPNEIINAPSILRALNSREWCSREKNQHAQYERTKLLNVFITRILATLIPSDMGLIINCVTPGVTYTNIMHKAPLIESLFVKWLFMPVMARDVSSGSRIIVRAAIESSSKPTECTRLHGTYMSNNGVVEPADIVLGEAGNALGRRIWDETIEVLSAFDSKVPIIIKQELRVAP